MTGSCRDNGGKKECFRVSFKAIITFITINNNDKRHLNFGGWVESFLSFPFSFGHCWKHDWRANLLTAAKDERKEGEYTCVSHPHLRNDLDGAERGAQGLIRSASWFCCRWAKWYLYQTVRCVACRHPRVFSDRQRDKDLRMWGEKRHRRNFLSVSLSFGTARRGMRMRQKCSWRP